MSNKVQFGLSEIYVATVTETDGVTNYGTPTAIKGGVSLTATPNSEEINFEADNDPNYFSAYSNAGYNIEMAMALIPDSFKVDYLGYKKDANGLVVEDATAIGKPFALLFQVEGDAEAVRCIYYKCTAGRPTLAPKTGKTPEAQTVPVVVGKPVDSDYAFGYARKSENPTAYDAWFSTVQQFTEGI